MSIKEGVREGSKGSAVEWSRQMEGKERLSEVGKGTSVMY